jgi:2-keto-3-deoxy-L-rhamnonate aldolase RhmA
VRTPHRRIRNKLDAGEHVFGAVAQLACRDVAEIGLIEDLEGVENVEGIAAESGLDGLVLGPFDLAQSSGLEGDVRHLDIEAMRAKVTAAARKAEIEYISLPGWEFGGFPAMAMNSRMFIVAGDRGNLCSVSRDSLGEFISELARADGAAAR